MMLGPTETKLEMIISFTLSLSYHMVG